MVKIIILVNLVIFSSGFVSADSKCGDWINYRDEKCIKVINTLTPFSGAAKVCEKEGATFGIIGSDEEQKLIEADLKKQNIQDDVWMAIKQQEFTFLTLDGKALKYTNWANGRPLNDWGVDCVVLSREKYYFNTWTDINCDWDNAVLCEKVVESQESTKNDHTQNIKMLSNRLDLLEAKLEKRDQEINNLKQNSVPIGFIYIQLSGQSEPHTLWPQTKWSDISSKYAGLFFRAEGGNSSSFGITQNQQIPTLKFQIGDCGKYPKGCDYTPYLTEENARSVKNKFNDKLYQLAYKAGGGGTWSYGINFKYTNAEIRPRNQAIRIWIRI